MPAQLPLFPDEPPPRARDRRLLAPSPCGLPPGLAGPPGLALGTCSFSHPSWRGVFYPRELPPSLELAYYARFRDAVEVDATFYRVPSPGTVARWVEETPEGFRFALKAPRRLTHDAALSLDDRGAQAEWEALLALVPRFAPREVTLLLQLGPATGIRFASRLDAVLSSVPAAVPVAVELRHPSWNRKEANGLLRARGAARALTDAYLDPRRGVREDDPWAFEETAPFDYVRLLGDTSTKYDGSGSLRHDYGSVLFDRRDDLARWTGRLAASLARGRRVEVYVNNHYEGFSLLTAETLRAALAAGSGQREGRDPLPPR